jgi:hypothetical protein
VVSSLADLRAAAGREEHRSCHSVNGRFVENRRKISGRQTPSPQRRRKVPEPVGNSAPPTTVGTGASLALRCYPDEPPDRQPPVRARALCTKPSLARPACDGPPRRSGHPVRSTAAAAPRQASMCGVTSLRSIPMLKAYRMCGRRSVSQRWRLHQPLRPEHDNRPEYQHDHATEQLEPAASVFGELATAQRNDRPSSSARVQENPPCRLRRGHLLRAACGTRRPRYCCDRKERAMNLAIRLVWPSCLSPWHGRFSYMLYRRPLESR